MTVEWADLQHDINEIMLAGFQGRANPYFVLFDAHGQRWPKNPSTMGPRDIAKYVRVRFGNNYLLKLRPIMTVN
jgi:hypothetical protein